MFAVCVHIHIGGKREKGQSVVCICGISRCLLGLIDIVVSSEGVFVLVRRIVEGAAHPGRRKKKQQPTQQQSREA